MISEKSIFGKDELLIPINQRVFLFLSSLLSLLIDFIAKYVDIRKILHR
jgi:hypothetical protein